MSSYWVLFLPTGVPAPRRSPFAARSKLVAAIIKIYATFGGSVFCSQLRADSLSVRSTALFIAIAKLSSSLVLSASSLNSTYSLFGFLSSPFTFTKLSLGFLFAVASTSIAGLRLTFCSCLLFSFTHVMAYFVVS